ncbi:MAG: MFS family permease [Candidatus Woesearchaeota archaeon]|jgi:MFS family permease
MERHHHHMHYFKNTPITRMYISNALRSFSLSLFGIFIPLILINLEYSIQEVFYFYFIVVLGGILGHVFAVPLIRKFGIKHTMLMSIPFVILFNLGMYTLVQYQWPIGILAAVHSLSIPLYWLPFHIEFSAHADSKKTGKQVGILQSSTIIASILGPIIGGWIIFWLGPQALIAASTVVIIGSGFALLSSEDEKITIDFHPHDITTVLTRKQRIAFLADGVRQYIAALIWPMFIFLTGVGFLIVGSIMSIVRVVMAITSFILGKIIDTPIGKKIFHVGTIVHSVTFAIRGFLSTIGGMTAITSMGGFSFILFHTPYTKIWYERARVGGAKFVLLRELYFDVGRLFAISSALILYSITGSNFSLTAIILFFTCAVAIIAHSLIE